MLTPGEVQNWEGHRGWQLCGSQRVHGQVSGWLAVPARVAFSLEFVPKSLNEGPSWEASFSFPERICSYD